MKRELDAAVAILSKAYAAGATLIAGSESGFAMTPYGEWHTREMELFVSHLGMGDMEALLCMTRNAAVGRAPRQRAAWALCAPASSPICWWWTATPTRTCASWATSSRLLSIVKGGEEVAPSGRGGTIRQRFEQARRYTHHLHTRAAAASLD